MTDSSSPVIFLPGAGGGAPDLDVFREGAEDVTRFEVIGYPGWRRLVADRLSGGFDSRSGGADSNKGATGTDPHRWLFNWWTFRLRSRASPPGDGSRNSRFLRDRYLYDGLP